MLTYRDNGSFCSLTCNVCVSRDRILTIIYLFWDFNFLSVYLTKSCVVYQAEGLYKEVYNQLQILHFLFVYWNLKVIGCHFT